MSAQTVHYALIESPVGPLLLAATERGLRCLQFHRGKLPDPAKDEVWIESPAELRPYQEKLQAYFRGELRDFDFDLDLVGTEFQKKCWHALCKIPYGHTCTYAELAEKLWSLKSLRSVGLAKQQSHIDFVVQCHRMIVTTVMIN